MRFLTLGVYKRMFVPPMPASLEDLRHRIVNAVKSLFTDRFDFWRTTHSAHIEFIQVEQR